MTAVEIAAALGGACRSGAWWRCCCPVHHSRGPTLALRDGPRGLIVHCHAGCPRAEVLAELRRLGLRADDGGPIARPDPAEVERHRAAEDDARIAAARRLWTAAQNASGGPVVRYLAGRRITIPPPPSLRYAPALRCPDGRSGPAMIARIDSLDGELIGVHRTWIDRGPDGIWRRRDRAMLGRAAGGAVRLAPMCETLLVGEGVETCLAAMQATARPAWAALSTSGLIGLRLPPIVQRVVILADNDANGAGERAARAVAARWLAEGRRVRIVLPPEPGADFNDVLTSGGADSTDVAA